MTELTIDYVCPKGPIYPMIIDFQNGCPSEDFEINCEVLQDKDGSRTIATELSELVYAGKEVTEDLEKTLILARNRKTGKVRLIEVGRVELKPVSNIDLEVDTTQQQETSRLELSRKFGSKKQKKQKEQQKKQKEQQEKLKVNQMVTEQMEKVTANISVDELDLTSYNKNDSDDFYVPPIDDNNKKPAHNNNKKKGAWKRLGRRRRRFRRSLHRHT